MKKIINFLRKIGLLHISKGDYYTGEYDDRKDLKDVEKNIKKDTQKNNGKTFPPIFLIIGIIGILIVLLSLILLGFSIWFFLILFGWIIFLFYFRQNILAGIFVFKSFIIFFIVLFVINFFVIIFTIDDGNTSTKSVLLEKTQYSTISKNNELSGIIDLYKRKNKAGNIEFQAHYDLTINTNLKEDKNCISRNNNCNGVYSYKYLGELNTSNNKYNNPGVTNDLNYPHVNNGMSPVHTFTNKFYKTYSSLDEFLAANIYKIYDGSKYQIKIKDETVSKDNSTQTSTVWIMDREKTLKQGRVARVYNLIIKKK